MRQPVVGPHLDDIQGTRSLATGVRYPGVLKLLLVYTVAGALASARYRLSFGHIGLGVEGWTDLLGCTVWFYPWALLTPMVFRFEQKYPLGAAIWLRHLGILAGLCIPLCLVASPLMMASFALIHWVLGSPIPWPPRAGFWLGGLPTSVTIFWCSVAGGYFLRTLFQLHQQEQRAAHLALEKSELEASLNRSQLETIRARLNPHFLFNSLQNISVLATRDPQTTSRMLMVLGDLLRAVLRRDSQSECALREEIELTRSYVTLEQMRFADRLRVSFEIASEIEGAMIPCFLMQPLVENAIVHGLRGVHKTGIIVVSARPESSRLVMTITDNGLGLSADTAGLKIGVGLGSTCERLQRMYAEHHEFSIRKLEEGGTEVRIAIPLRFGRTIDESSLHEETPALNR